MVHYNLMADPSLRRRAICTRSPTPGAAPSQLRRGWRSRSLQASLSSVASSPETDPSTWAVRGGLIRGWSSSSLKSMHPFIPRDGSTGVILQGKSKHSISLSLPPSCSHLFQNYNLSGTRRTHLSRGMDSTGAILQGKSKHSISLSPSLALSSLSELWSKWHEKDPFITRDGSTGAILQGKSKHSISLSPSLALSSLSELYSKCFFRFDSR